MAHDEHFLTRLDRLDAPLMEDALALYYDTRLVRRVLADAAERGHEDRVAISLDDPVEGPFVVVTQSGDFVTTLGRGMGVGKLAIVPRARWDAHRRRDLRMREAWARADEFSGPQLSAVGREVFGAGPRVSREAMQTMIMLGRVIERPMVAAWAQAQSDVLSAVLMIQNRASWRSLDDAFFDDAGRALWHMAHLSVAVGAGDFKKHVPTMPDYQWLADREPSAMAVRLGILGPAARMLWLVGKSGGFYFDAMKHTFKDPPDWAYAFDSALGLAAIAQRFTKYRGEVRKLLDIAEKPNPSRQHHLRRISGQLASRPLRDDYGFDEHRDAIRGLGRAYWMRYSSQLPREHPLRFVSADAVPDELALPILAASELNIMESADGSHHLATAAVPVLMTMTADELYLPRAAQAVMPRHDFAPSMKRALQRIREAQAKQHIGVTAPSTPGRNAQCPCNSGVKYKRCCGGERRRAA